MNNITSYENSRARDELNKNYLIEREYDGLVAFWKNKQNMTVMTDKIDNNEVKDHNTVQNIFEWRCYSPGIQGILKCRTL